MIASLDFKKTEIASRFLGPRYLAAIQSFQRSAKMQPQMFRSRPRSKSAFQTTPPFRNRKHMSRHFRASPHPPLGVRLPPLHSACQKYLVKWQSLWQSTPMRQTTNKQETALNTWLRKVLPVFWTELGKISRLTKFRRKTIALILFRLNVEARRKWEAELWKNTASKNELKEWLIDCKKESQYDDTAFLELAKLLPQWAKRSLLDVAQTLPAPHRSGRQFKLRFRERQFVLTRYNELKEEGLPNRDAYEKIAKEVKRRSKKSVSTHTVRIMCDPGERKRLERERLERKRSRKLSERKTSVFLGDYNTNPPTAGA